MSEGDLLYASLTDIAQRIRTRDVSCIEMVRTTLDRIEAFNSELNCFITVTREQAERDAQSMDAQIRQGTYLGPLHGVPISLKDNIATAGIRTTAGSPILAEWVPSKNATVVDRLRSAGAIIVGKANTYEFAFGAPHPRYGPTHNPWNLKHSCGGSSSGSAASVAAGLCYGSIGTDTGGSIRIPATFCGVVGLKPTYGLVSRSGIIPVSYNMDHVGPLARTVPDAALILNAIAGFDTEDPTTSRKPVPDFGARLDDGVKGLRLGTLAPQPTEAITPEVHATVFRAYTVLEREGAVLTEVPLPDLTVARTVNWVICGAEAAEYHRPYLRTRAKEYHPIVRDLLEGGEFIPATEYVHAQRVRQRLIHEARSALADVDALLLPALATDAYPIGQRTLQLDEQEEDVLQVITRYTALFDLTGQPAVVVPCGFSPRGLPIGLQVVGRAFDDATVLRVARTYERATTWHTGKPHITDRKRDT